jgi:filamentous hemagglutinin
LGASINAGSLAIEAQKDVIIVSASAFNNHNNSSNFQSQTQTSIASNIAFLGEVSINLGGSFLITPGQTSQNVHCVSSHSWGNFFGGTTTVTSNVQSVINNASTLSAGGSINITAGQNLSVVGSNIEAGRDASLTSQNGM